MELLQSFDKFDPKDKNSKIMIKSDNIKLMSDVIKKGSPIPYDNTKTYHTLRDYQEAVEIEV
jgi:molecular chaperone DnaK (HSP70)